MEVGDADLRDLLGCEIGQTERIVRANFDAARAFEEAKGRGVVEARFQQSFEPVFEKRRLQHVRRARADAQVAGGATVEKLIDAPGAGRTDGGAGFARANEHGRCFIGGKGGPGFG